ncbi:MAG: hypothetical protein AAF799_04430 [Myxococcota bacterium]
MSFTTTLVIAAFFAASEPGSAANETRELFDRAATQYQTSDYRGAVDSYTEAYRLSSSIEDSELRGSVQAAILYNLARAHSKAYRFDENPEHLRQQIDLLEKYLAQTADLADQQDARALLAEARKELEIVLATESPEEPESDADEARSTEGIFLATTPSPTDDEPPKGRGMEIAGYVLLGLGVGSGGAAITGAVLSNRARDEHIAGPTLSDRNAAESKGSLGNGLIVGGSVAAGVLVTTGVALLIAGRKRRNGPTPTAWVSPNGAGISMGGRF